MNYFQGILQIGDLIYPSETDRYYDDFSLTNLNIGEQVTITLESQQFAPQLELLPADNLNETIDLQTGQGITQIAFTVEPGIQPILRATSQDLPRIGAYTLTTSSGDLNPVPLYQVEALTQQDQYRWQPNRPLGRPITLTYSFMEELPSYYKPNGKGEWDDRQAGSFKPLSDVQQDAVRLALQEWASVSGLKFREVSDSRSVQIRFGTAKDLSGEGLYGWAYYPTEPVTGGDMWLNHADPSNRNPKPGSYGFSTILHEIGHTLGLSHPFDEGTTLPQAEQTVQYTVMAYDPHPYLPERYQPRTPMLYDIAAIQRLYGKNQRTGAGNTVYQWGPDETFIETIYDVGGVDTVNAKNQWQNVLIDLEPGKFSSIGSFRARPTQENVAIAYGVTLENAIGGAGDDRLIGNDANNRLIGSAGADTLTGLAGNDRLTGGLGADIFVFQTEADGVDRITDFESQDTLDVTLLLNQIGYTGVDPVLEGVLIISVQQEDTVISLDKDGLRGTAAAVPLVILENFTNFATVNLTTSAL